MQLAARPDSIPEEELERLVRRVEPAARLVPPRILRRVIKTHRGLGGLGLRVPHRKSAIIDRESLLKIATPQELGHDPAGLPDVVLLFPRPAPAELAGTTAGAALRDYWRLLFHTRVHLALSARKLDDSDAQERVRALGRVVFEEARAVLRQEQYLFDPDDTVAVYEEFAAVFLELRYFDPERASSYFPAAEDLGAVEHVFAQDVEADALYRQTRPEGADEEVTPPPPPAPEAEPDDRPEKEPPAALQERSKEAARRGNQVRAALLRLRAATKAPPTQAGSLRGPARLEIDKLAGRLQKALRFPEREKDDWARCLWVLAERAARGVWNPEMRLLSDLQRACLDNERELYAADFVESFVTWFQRPLKRPLPDLPLVLTVQRLRQAQHRLTVARMPAEDRARFSDLLAASLAAAEGRLRDAFRPQLAEAFAKVGLEPANAAERLARDKLVEELLDDIARNGYLTIGDLRDAVARNRLKLPDLASPVEVLTGDQLIRLNRELARDLDGVYRRGEVYLRWLQRLSSVFFGNHLGRLLTLYVILPLLGSLFILKGIEGLADEVHHWVLTPLLGLEAHHAPEPGPPVEDDDWMGTEDAPPEAKEVKKKLSKPPTLPLYNTYSFLSLAVFLFLVMHVPPFRRAVVTALWHLWRVVRGLLYDLPTGIFRLPAVRAVLQSREFLLFWQWAGKPILWGFAVSLVPRLRGAGLPVTLSVGATAAALAAVVINTRLGLLVEETTSDWLARTWQLVREDLVPGLFRWLMWVSKWLHDRVEKVRYTVEEWLLFREGQSQLTFWLKLLLGLPWFVVSYVGRFILLVLLEPQVNPIKHFPVVTVSHKLMLVIAPPVASALAAQLGWKEIETLPLVISVFSLIPGLFGFLAWELKENWKLYRANQSPTLQPEVVGSHGEKVINYIRPGFHSGTLPKLFARLRRGRGATARKQEEGLHHAEEELRHFVERELLAPLAASKAWLPSSTIAVGHVRLATNRIRVELVNPGVGPGSCWLDFVNRDGELAARLTGPGWMAEVAGGPRAAFANALTGLYKRAGVETIDPPEGGAPFPLGERPVTWHDWVACWERDQAGEPHTPLVPGVALLPA